MLHSNSNTHAHQDLNKGSNLHRDNTVSAQGVSYNPTGSNTDTTNIKSTYNTTNNPTSNYDNLTNQTNNLDISNLSSNTANPNTKANIETIGGVLGSEAHNSHNTSSNPNTYNSSNPTMGNVQPTSTNNHSGSYPSHSSNAPLDTKLTGQADHASSMNSQSLGSNTNQINPQTGAHSSQYGNTTHDKLSHNTTNVHNSTNTNSSKLVSGTTQAPLYNEHSTDFPNSPSNTPIDTTASGEAVHGNPVNDQKLRNNTHGHTSSTVPTGPNDSTVNDEIHGVEFGKAPIHGQTISGDHKHKKTHPHQTNNPERVGETHLHDQVISKDIKNASPKSGTHSRSFSNNSSERIGENRQDDKEVAEGLISEKTHAHLDHTPEKVKENHKLDLAEPLDDKRVYADPNSTSLYNEYTPAAPGEGVKPSNPDVTTLESGSHHKPTAEANLRASENNNHGSSTLNTGSATGAALGSAGLANAYSDKHSGASPSNENTQQPSLTGNALNSSNVPGTADIPAASVKNNNDYSGSTTSNHSSSNHSHGIRNTATGAAVGAGATGIASSLSSHSNKPPHDTSLGTNNNSLSEATFNDRSSVNPSHGISSVTGSGSSLDSHHTNPTNTISSGTYDKLSGAATGNHFHGARNTATGAALGATSLSNSHHTKHESSAHNTGLNNNTSAISSGDLGSTNLYESQQGSSTHNSGLNTSTEAAELTNLYDEKHSGVIPNNTNAQQPSLTGNALNNSNVPGTADIPVATIKNNF